MINPLFGIFSGSAGIAGIVDQWSDWRMRDSGQGVVSQPAFKSIAKISYYFNLTRHYLTKQEKKQKGIGCASMYYLFRDWMEPYRKAIWGEQTPTDQEQKLQQIFQDDSIDRLFQNAFCR